MNRITVSDGVAHIELSQGQVALVDEDDLPLVVAYTWHAVWNPDIMSYYASTGVSTPSGKKTTLYMHRVVVGAPKGRYVDHGDHDTLNNRRSNLTLTTNSQNMQNRAGANTNSKTGIRGVSVHKTNSGVGLLYVARVHRPGGVKDYACRYFPFTTGGLLAAVQQVNAFVEAHGEMAVTQTVDHSLAGEIHARMTEHYADRLKARQKRARRSHEARTVVPSGDQGGMPGARPAA